MKKQLFKILILILIFGVSGYCDNNTEFVVEDDLTVNGTQGTYLDPDVELKGFVVIGATQPSYTANIPAGPGNVIINGTLGVSSGAYIVGNTTITYITSATFSGASSIFIGGGTAGYLLRSKSSPVGELEWVNPLDLDLDVKGDNLGNHIATMTLTANYGIEASSISISGAGVIGTNPLFQVVNATMVILNNGNVNIGTAGPGEKLDVAGMIRSRWGFSPGDGTNFQSSRYMYDDSANYRTAFSSNVYIVGYASATKFFGDGSGLTGISASVPPSINVSTINATVPTPYGGINITSNTYIVGNLVIGSTNPVARLYVEGGQYIRSVNNKHREFSRE